MPTIALNSVKTFERKICHKLRLVVSGMRLVSPRCTRDSTSLRDSPLAAGRRLAASRAARRWRKARLWRRRYALTLRW